jgi:hypothetical protein
MNRVKLTPLMSVFLVFISLAFLGIVTIGGAVRVYVEYKFRKKLKDKPKLM